MKTNRYEIAFLLAVCVLSLFALACDGTPTSCTNSTRTQGNDEFKRWVAVVSKNGAAVAGQLLAPPGKE